MAVASAFPLFAPNRVRSSRQKTEATSAQEKFTQRTARNEDFEKMPLSAKRAKATEEKSEEDTASGTSKKRKTTNRRLEVNPETPTQEADRSVQEDLTSATSCKSGSSVPVDDEGVRHDSIPALLREMIKLQRQTLKAIGPGKSSRRNGVKNILTEEEQESVEVCTTQIFPGYI